MKRLSLIILPALLICAATLQATQVPPNDTTPAEGSREMHHPLLAKVFPGVVFMEEPILNAKVDPWVYNVVAWFENRRFLMPIEFNVLYGQVASKSKATVKERIECLARLYYWEYDSDLIIMSNEKKTIEVSDKPFPFKVRYDYRLLIGFHGANESSPPLELLVRFNRDQINSVRVRSDGSCYDVEPIMIDCTDTIELEIFGVLPVIYPGDPIEHFYIPTAENGIPQTQYVQLIVSGLRRERPYYMAVRPFYWTDNSLTSRCSSNRP